MNIYYPFFPSFSIGYLNSIIQLVVDFVIRNVFPQSTYQPLQPQTVPSAPTTVKTQTNWPQQPNNLISNANQMADANFDFTVKQWTVTIVRNEKEKQCLMFI